MKKFIVLFVAVFLLSCLSVSATTIHGDIYDITLNKLKDTIVEIDTEPKQAFVAKDGTYSFDIHPGEYTLVAKYYENNLLKFEVRQEITVEEEGDFTIDLILFPSLEEYTFFNETELELIEIYKNGKTSYWPYIILIVVAGLIVFFYFKFFRKKRVKVSEDGDELKTVLEIIKKHGNRTTQKEIRKELKLSEAKISLMISELEDKGDIKKIKKGRGNIIILVKK